MPINRFVHEENLRHLRAVLARTTDETESRRILTLIEEEEAKRTPEPHLRESP